MKSILLLKILLADSSWFLDSSLNHQAQVRLECSEYLLQWVTEYQPVSAKTGATMEDQHDRNDPFEEALLDLGSKTNDELRELIGKIRLEEEKVSYQRRILHGRIDILRAELVNRLKSQHEAGADLISGSDVERLIDILSADSRSLSNIPIPQPSPADPTD